MGWLPPKDLVKLNTDGSLDPELGTACTGGLPRDHLGHWLGGFHRNMTAISSLMAELWALRDGLSLAKAENMKKLEIEVDTLGVANY